MIIWRFVSKKYANKRYYALHNICLNIEKGDFVILKGASGSGKTTFFKLMICEEKITEGEIFFDRLKLSTLRSRQICKLRRRIGMVFQDYKLLKDKTIYENIEFILNILNFNHRRKKNQIMDALNLTNMRRKSDQYPDELSGGEQQRVAIARAFAIQPMIILADEPTGNLDHENTMDVIRILLEINSFGTTVIMSTHNERIISMLNKRVINIENGRLTA